MKSREFDRPPHEIIVIAHNIRSVLNVGAILRTCEGFGVQQVFASGYTPNLEFSCHLESDVASPKANSASSKPVYQKILPHVRDKLLREIHKSALGAEEIVDFRFAPDVFDLIKNLRRDNFTIVGLEQDERAISLPDFNQFFAEKYQQKNQDSPAKIALILGEEVNGLTRELRETCDELIEIPMFGRKESFNVSVAAGIAIYELINK